MALHQVTSLTTSAVQTVVVVPSMCEWVVISNVGANQVNLGLSGGTALTGGTDPATGATGLGTPIAAGAQLVLYGPYFRGTPIRGIMAAGTTTLNIEIAGATVQSGTFPIN